MAMFRYRAMNVAGSIVRDEMVAPDRVALGVHLNQLGLDLLSCRELSADRLWLSRLRLQKRPDSWALLQSLAFLMESGLPILESLELLTQQWKSQPAVVYLISDWQKLIMSGSSFSEALGESGAQLDVVSIALIKAGEQSGSLITAIETGAAEFARAQLLRQQLIKAMAYPVITFITLLVAMGVMLYAVLPLLLGLARSQHLVLPWYTEWLGVASLALHRLTWQWLLICAGGLCMLGLIVAVVPAIRQSLFQWRYRLPILGAYSVQSDLVRCLRSLYLLYRSGIPLAEAFPLCRGSLRSKRLIVQWQLVIEGIHSGQGFHRAMTSYLDLPAHYQRLIAIAEESGQLEHGLAQVIKLLDQALEAQREKWLSQLQPIMLSLIGVLMYWVISTLTELMYGQMGALHP